MGGSAVKNVDHIGPPIRQGEALLVEIRPEGGRRHNSPLIIPLSSGSTTTFATFTNATHRLLLP
jgi:hypothetical protein